MYDKTIKQKAEKKWPITNSLDSGIFEPIKLDSRPGIYDLKPSMFVLKKNSIIKSVITINNIIDQNLYNWLISSLLKDLIKWLKDKINPNITINFNTLG